MLSTVQTHGTNYGKVHSQKLHSVHTVGCTVTRICTFILSLIFNMRILKTEFFKDMKLCHLFSYRPLVGQLFVVCFPGLTTHCGCIFTARQRALTSSFSRFLDHTQRRATIGRTLLDEWSIRRRDLYLTTHNTHNRHPCPRWYSNPQSQQASGRRPTS
jgi:hypothetical protein